MKRKLYYILFFLLLILPSAVKALPTQARQTAMVIYMICGFTTFASMGIQIGGNGSLSPSRRIMLSRIGMKAPLAGTITSLIPAALVSMII